MKKTIMLIILTAFLFSVSFFYIGYSIDWLKVESRIVKVALGEESMIKIHVGEGVSNQRVRLTIIGEPSWLNYSFSIEEGRTPFITNLTIKVPVDAPPGNYTLTIGLLTGRILLEQENITLIVLATSSPPTIYFTNYTCPSTAVTEEKIPLDLSFNYVVYGEARIRVRILLDGQLETMIEFRLSGNGSIPMYRQISAPSDPKDIMITSTIEYFDPFNNTWILSDSAACRVKVTPIPTMVKIFATGLPLNVETTVQVLILPEGSIIERKISSMSEHKIVLSIHQPSTILVIVEDEVTLPNRTKYIAENNLREIYVEPGWTITIRFSYSPFYLVSTRVEPDEDILNILERDEWVKKDTSFPVTAPRIFESRSRKYVLSEVNIDGKTVKDVPDFVVRTPHKIIYRYVEYDKLSIVSEVELPQTVSSKKYSMDNLLLSVDESTGEYWVKKGEIIKIPFRNYVLDDLQFVPSSFESSLGADLEDGIITVLVDRPGSVKLYYRVEAKLNIIVKYSSVETQRIEAWVPIGTQYRIYLSTFLSPRTIGERLELRNLASDLTYEFLRNNETIVLLVDSPGEVDIHIDRYFLVRIYTLTLSDKKYPSCLGPPSLTGWSNSEDFDEIWVLEKTSLTCYFPEKIDEGRISIVFVRGWVGSTKYETPGLKSFYIDKPTTIRMEYNVVEYFQLKGRTDKGVFIGEGTYPRGARIAWRVEPQEYPCDGLLGLLGFKFRAINPYGVEEIQGDKTIEVTWVPTPSVESPIIQFLLITSISIASYIAWEYHKMWRIKITESIRGEEDIEG